MTPTEEDSALDPTDAELVAAACGETPHAFATLFDRHYDAIAGDPRRRIGVGLADELAAETFLQAFAARARYDATRADARPWLRHRRQPAAAPSARGGAAPACLRARGRQRRRRVGVRRRRGAPRRRRGVGCARDGAVRTGLGERDVLLLHAWADLSYEGIAEALAIPVGTVRSRLHRGRRGVVRELLARNGEGAGDPIAAAPAAAREELR